MNSINQNNASPHATGIIWPGLLVALIIAVSLSGIANHDLWTPDEPREAAISLSMSRSGDLVIPELAGKPFVEKPPLFYVITSFFLLVFGNIIGNTTALRLVPACFGLGTLFFAYLLGKIYFDRQKALIASGILATMLGFVHLTHWILVDNALMFFIIASIWALARAYSNLTEPARARPGSRDNRLPCLVLAGIFAACAFLTKGFIGPLIITIAWVGMFITLINKPGGEGILSIKSILFHFIGLIAAVLISSSWILLFYLNGDPELFHEWWWTNHFGRFSGQATNLGHISPWHYYFAVLPVYILPWLAPFLVALGHMFKKIYRRETLPTGILMLSFWIIGTFVLFSLSATKREIYLGAFLPACALFCASGLKEKLSRLDKVIYRLWLTLLFAGTAIGISVPFVAHKFSQIPAVLFGWPHALALAVIITALFILINFRTPFLHRFLIVTMMLYSTILIIYCPLVDAYKSYGNSFRTAAYAIKAHPEIKIAGWNLDETTVAGFYYYCNLTFPSITDQKMLDNILDGKDTRFNGVITLQKKSRPNGLPVNENQVIFKLRMGKRRLLQLIAAEESRRPRITN